MSIFYGKAISIFLKFTSWYFIAPVVSFLHFSIAFKGMRNEKSSSLTTS